MASAICPNCRKPLPENAHFCVECGSRIDINITRKKLGNEYLEEHGLKIDRNEAVKSPFYGKYNKLKDKIINPKLEPLPEKKKFTFKSWDEIKNSIAESETENSRRVETIDEVTERDNSIEEIAKEEARNELSDTITEIENDELENPEQLLGAAPNGTSAEESDTNATADFSDAMLEETLAGDLSTEINEGENVKENLTANDTEAEADVLEEPQQLLEVDTDNSTVFVGTDEISKKDVTEELIELQEEATDFEALKELFAETDGLIARGEEELKASDSSIKEIATEEAEKELSDTLTEISNDGLEEPEQLLGVAADDNNTSSEESGTIATVDSSDAVLEEAIVDDVSVGITEVESVEDNLPTEDTEAEIDVLKELQQLSEADADDNTVIVLATETLTEDVTEETIEQPKDSIEELIDQPIEKTDEFSPSFELELKTEVVKATVKHSSPESLEGPVVSHEQNNGCDIGPFTNDLSENICNQIEVMAEKPEEQYQNNINRIITNTVGGGFKKKEPQAEEMKDVWKPLLELLKR